MARHKEPSVRQLRVGEELRHALAEAVGRGELRDPELRGRAITITEVRASPDLKRATAFVSFEFDDRFDYASKIDGLLRESAVSRDLADEGDDDGTS